MGARQIRSAEHVFDSLSGHGYMVECKTSNAVSMGVLCKICSVCKNNRRNIEPPPHQCVVNYKGSADGMKSKLCIDLARKISDDYEAMATLEISSRTMIQ